MDDLQMLRAALTGPGPSGEAAERSRHRLQNAMRGPKPPKRRTRWLAAGIGLTATAATAAVVIASTVTATPNSPRAPARLSGQQVLLAAATSAESRPATQGVYWYVRTVSVSADGIRRTRSTWTRPDGRTWISVEPGKISKLRKRKPIKLRFTNVDYEQIQRLPTDPARLLWTLRTHMKHGPGGQPGKFSIQEEFSIHLMLREVLERVPAPPQVRAAAFRALASLPNMRNLGRVEGGYRLEFFLRARPSNCTTEIIVDPKATTLRAGGFTCVGDKHPVGSTTWTAEWTNQLPPYQVVPLSRQKESAVKCPNRGDTEACSRVDPRDQRPPRRR